VRCAAGAGVKVTARSGGHSYAAYGIGGQNGNLLVDLKFLKEITLNSDNTVVSGAGNRLGDLAQRIFDLGNRALPHGTCPYVGTGGHTGYGGFGLFSRKQGLLVDTVVSAQVVLANGTLITANNATNTDIFWVCILRILRLPPI
jgi:FAD/FMN-containing dehydrogenase